MKRQSKFNVNKDIEKRSCDSIVFDSTVEMQYYRDVILPLCESGEITYYERQKVYTLQPKFNKNGKKILPIDYKADFYIEYKNGEKKVVDIKGFADSVALLKRKMFWYMFPNIDYIWMSYVKKYGGWIDYDELKIARRKDKKEKKGNENQKGTKRNIE